MGRLNIKVKNTIKEKDASTSNESKKVYKINFGMKKSSSISNTNINKEPEIKENQFLFFFFVFYVSCPCYLAPPFYSTSKKKHS